MKAWAACTNQPQANASSGGACPSATPGHRLAALAQAATGTHDTGQSFSIGCNAQADSQESGPAVGFLGSGAEGARGHARRARGHREEPLLPEGGQAGQGAGLSRGEELCADEEWARIRLSG